LSYYHIYMDTWSWRRDSNSHFLLGGQTLCRLSYSSALLAQGAGLEPATTRFGGVGSTIELPLYTLLLGCEQASGLRPAARLLTRLFLVAFIRLLMCAGCTYES